MRSQREGGLSATTQVRVLSPEIVITARPSIGSRKKTPHTPNVGLCGVEGAPGTQPQFLTFGGAFQGLVNTGGNTPFRVFVTSLFIKG